MDDKSKKLKMNQEQWKAHVDEVDELCQRALDDRRFRIAFLSLPDADVEMIRKVAGQEDADEMFYRYQLVQMRWQNPICAYCGNKQEPKKLKRCTQCYLEFYCNRECQAKHWKTHKARCGKVNGPLDEGYQRIVALQAHKDE